MSKKTGTMVAVAATIALLLAVLGGLESYKKSATGSNVKGATSCSAKLNVCLNTL